MNSGSSKWIMDLLKAMVKLLSRNTIQPILNTVK